MIVVTHRRLLPFAIRCFVVFGWTAVLQQAALTQEVSQIACLVGAGDTGEIHKMHDFPGGGVLVQGEKGWFLAREINGKVEVTPAGDDLTGVVFKMLDLPHSSIIRAKEGLFVAREVDGKVNVTRAASRADIGVVLDIDNLPHDSVLVRAKSWFLAREVGGKVKVEPIGDGQIRTVYDMRALPHGSVLVRAEEGLFVTREIAGNFTTTRVSNADTGVVSQMHGLSHGSILIGAEKGLFLAREVDGQVKVVPVGDSGSVEEMSASPHGVVLIRAKKGWFLGHEVDGKVTVVPAGGADIGSYYELRDLTPDSVLIGSKKGLFFAREIDGKARIELLADAGSVEKMHDFPGGGVLVQTEKGWFLARDVDRKVNVTRAGDADTAYVQEIRDLANGLLIIASKGLFVAREVDDKVRLARIAGGAIGSVKEVIPSPDGSVLIEAEQGWFLAREVDGQLSIMAIGNPDFKIVSGIRGLPNGSVLVGSRMGLSVAVRTPLARAIVEIQDKKNLDGSLVDPVRNLLVVFAISHGCAQSDKMELNVRAIAPGDKPPGKFAGRVQRITPGATAAELALSSIFDKPGKWSFQVVATSGGVERPVGEVQTLTFVVAEPWWQRWWKILTIGFGGAIALTSIILFGFARRYAWAWRLATDDSLSTWVLRVATLALSHVPLAQLWILDLYFQRVRARLQEPRPFLPLPLTATDGHILSSTEALGPPWKNRRLWVQGASGMGKTAVFRFTVESSFRDHPTAFAAYAKCGCIVVPFAARDFASSGEDKDDPSWVVDAVRATLSSEGLAFGNGVLLSRFLECGTIGVAIDGLNEVDRTRAVTAFSRTFSEAPMLITSQQLPGSDHFVTWRLPTDIRKSTLELLRLYLKEHAEAVMERITVSGLESAIRSGYDVRLIIELARLDPYHAKLPADRMGLYAAVIEAGWPDAPENVRQEQQSATAFAAWRMVSERKPNEDMRRLKPDVDLPATLLMALADAPQNDNRSVRLVRRVGAGAFEFVHDQMHAYLAARWFAQDGFAVGELEKMITSSTIWMQSPDARRTLWSFAAALLDDTRLIELWARIEDNEEWDILRRALKEEAEKRGLAAPRMPEVIAR